MELFFNYLNIFVKEMWTLCVDMAPYILLGMLVSGIISVFIDSDMIFRHIGPKNFISTKFGFKKTEKFRLPFGVNRCRYNVSWSKYLECLEEWSPQDPL